MEVNTLPIVRPDERLRAFSWPALREVETPSIDKDSCLVVCAGFEDRAVHTIRRIQEAGISRPHVVMIAYLPYSEANRIEGLREFVARGGFRVTEITYNRQEPSGIGETLRAIVGSYGHVSLDISGMSRLLIVQLIVALVGASGPDVTVIYCEARNYAPTQMQVERDMEQRGESLTTSYLSSGILEVASAAELCSVAMGGEAIRLVAFPSFDPIQLANLIQELQPTYADIIHGLPVREEIRWRKGTICELNRGALRELRGRNDYDTSTLDYRETLGVLLDIYVARSMFDRIVIAPTGSKMQSVAVGLVRSVLYDIQVVYPTPDVFATPGEYTTGVRQVYELDVPSTLDRGA